MTKERFESAARVILEEFGKGCSEAPRNPANCRTCLEAAVDALGNAAKVEVNETAESINTHYAERAKRRFDERKQYKQRFSIDDMLDDPSPFVVWLFKPKIVIGLTLVCIAVTVFIGRF